MFVLFSFCGLTFPDLLVSMKISNRQDGWDPTPKAVTIGKKSPRGALSESLHRIQEVSLILPDFGVWRTDSKPPGWARTCYTRRTSRSGLAPAHP
jgi:hypothetical protein